MPILKQNLLAVILISVSATLCSAQGNLKTHQPKLTPQQSNTTQLLISVSPVDSRVVWAAGTGGTYVVTTDGGDHWKSAVVPGAENDQFRDVHAVNAQIGLRWENLAATYASVVLGLDGDSGH